MVVGICHDHGGIDFQSNFLGLSEQQLFREDRYNRRSRRKSRHFWQVLYVWTQIKSQRTHCESDESLESYQLRRQPRSQTLQVMPNMSTERKGERGATLSAVQAFLTNRLRFEAWIWSVNQ